MHCTAPPASFSFTAHPSAMVRHRYRLGLPFAGCDGPGEAALRSGWPITICNVLEINANLTPFLSAKHGQRIEATDIMTINLSDIHDCDVLVQGPPCTPHSKLGARRGAADPVSKTFIAGINICKELDRRGCLKAVVFENTPSMAQNSKDANWAHFNKSKQVKNPSRSNSFEQDLRLSPKS